MDQMEDALKKRKQRAAAKGGTVADATSQQQQGLSDADKIKLQVQAPVHLAVFLWKGEMALLRRCGVGVQLLLDCIAFATELSSTAGTYHIFTATPSASQHPLTLPSYLFHDPTQAWSLWSANRTVCSSVQWPPPYLSSTRSVMGRGESHSPFQSDSSLCRYASDQAELKMDLPPNIEAYLQPPRA